MAVAAVAMAMAAVAMTAVTWWVTKRRLVHAEQRLARPR